MNGGTKLTKKAKIAIERFFPQPDYMENGSFVNLIPSKQYDLIIMNWVLKGLNDEDCKQLLFNLRKSLSLRRKKEYTNGVIMIKEPYWYYDRDATY